MRRVFFKTFGCRTNLFDTQVMKESLSNFALTEDESSADIIVVNSCTVTNGADTAVRSYVRSVRAKGKEVFFTGCGVRDEGRRLFDAGLVKSAFGHSQKEKISQILESSGRTFHYSPPENSHLDTRLVSQFNGKSRAFLKIQEGCNFRCSYCIIPSVRGISRSYKANDIIEQIKNLVSSGIKEVVLTGTNVGSFGRDSGEDISGLLLRISQIKGLKRVRIGSLEPSQIDERFLEMLDLEILERHLHIALQHTHDKMLAKMNRINRFKRDAALLEKIALKGFAIGTDLIIGHPGENEEIYAEGLLNLKALPLTHVHPFIYSKRVGTKSSTMPQAISQKGAKVRLHEIKDIVEMKNLEFRERFKDTPLQIIVEKGEEFAQDGEWGGEKSFIYSGFDQFYNKVKIKSKEDLNNAFLELKNYEVIKGHNYAEC